MPKTTMTLETVERQMKYVADQKSKGQGLGIVFADAFLRGMRDIGYKSPAWAAAEMIDNAFQSGATTVSMRIRGRGAKPEQIAVSDNGSGMIPEMISYAVRWGGTDREDDRKGFGRYGYGLPSSSVSIAKRYTVYSKTEKSDWHAVTVDIEDLAAAAGDLEKTEELLASRKANLPEWVLASEDKIELATMRSGTVIVLENLDRLLRTNGWKMTEVVRTKMLQYLGVIYRHWIPERKIFVGGLPVQAVDPLFLMEHGRFYNETPVVAQKVETKSFEVLLSSGKKGTVSIRASHLPASFQLEDPTQYGRRGAKNNKRLAIMKEYNGLLICREWRHIDTVQPRWTKFQNYDANVKIEINFDPDLDEYFGLTTSKQQIVIDDEMWEKLQHAGKEGGALIALVRDLRNRFEESQIELFAGAENRETVDLPRPSAEAMEKTEKFKDRVVEPTREEVEEAVRNLENAADEIAILTKKTKEEAVKELKEITAVRHWEIEFSAVPEGPFYRAFRLGEQKRVILNTDHPFYLKMYLNSGPDVRAALEVLLFVLAERELEAKGDATTFYKAERQKWSERLRHALENLGAEDAMADKRSAIAEMIHVAEDI